MNKFVHRTLCENYEQSAKALTLELRKHKQQIGYLDPGVVNSYHQNLHMLRVFLDNEGYVMPRPKWIYNDKDESTWLFTHRSGVNKSFLMLQSRRR